MASEAVILRCGVDGRTHARMRAVTGRDELALSQADFAAMVPIVGGLLDPACGGIGQDDLHALPLDDYDRLLAALFRSHFGDVAEIHMDCRACHERFEMSVTLAQAFPALCQPPGDRDAEAELACGTRLRALCVGDLLAAGGANYPAALVETATLVSGDDDPAAVAEALEALAPAAIDEIATRCPNCDAAITCLFDLGKFLLASWRRERGLLLREIHLLARQYGWSLAEILSLTRDTRQDLVALVSASAAATRRARAA